MPAPAVPSAASAVPPTVTGNAGSAKYAVRGPPTRRPTGRRTTSCEVHTRALRVPCSLGYRNKSATAFNVRPRHAVELPSSAASAALEDLAPAGAAVPVADFRIAVAAGTCQSGQSSPPHCCDPERAFGFEAAWDRAEFRQFVRAKQPPARRPPIAGDVVTGIPGDFGPMAPSDGAAERGAQYLMTAVLASRLSAPVFVEEAGDIGAHNQAGAEMAVTGRMALGRYDGPRIQGSSRRAGRDWTRGQGWTQIRGETGPRGMQGLPGPEKALVFQTVQQAGPEVICPGPTVVTGCSTSNYSARIQHSDDHCVVNRPETKWTEARCCSLK